ncbi:methyltransferase [Methanosarcinales archaeon]|nr:MAG: methyltransferase [Methanosarcinales archaeon]
MKKKELEIKLEHLELYTDPKLGFEQYATPPQIASALLYTAYVMGDLEGTVYDLGCGTGILGIGAKLLGAERVVGFDIDADALRIAMKNAKKVGVDVEFVLCDVILVPNTVRDKKATVVMNPPFGAQKKGSDRTFLSTALRIGDIIYSIHNQSSKEFVEHFIKPHRITQVYVMEYPMKKMFKHHKHKVCYIPVEVYRIKKCE